MKSISIPLLSAVAGIAVGFAACAEGVSFEEDDENTGGTGGGVSEGGGGGGVTTCNNGVIDPDEQCDDGNFAGWTCELLEFGGGTLACDPSTCTFDTTGCDTATCGNGVLEAGEECDGTDFGGATCQTLGWAGGVPACDATCLVTGCYDDYVEGFEAMTMPVGWTSPAGAGWFTSTIQPHGGTRCAESGNILESQQTTLGVTLIFDAAGSISFWHRVSSELNYDYLRFYIDGAMVNEWTGEIPWTQATFPVTTGTHVFSWVYSKDGSISSGSDTAWIDDVTAVGGYVP